MKAAYITPVVTLFHADGSLDRESNERLYQHLIANRMDGILVMGSIGEFFAMPLSMRRQAAELAIRTVKGRVRLLIGTGGMIYEEVASFSNECLEKGADAVIVMPPYFLALDDETVFAFYDRLAADVKGPMLLYNFPERMSYSISVDVAKRLAEKHPNILGLKDTVPGMAHTRELLRAILPVRPDFQIFSGFDDNLATNVLAGGAGCISGLSNVFPQVCSAWAEALRQNDAEGMALGQKRINRLFEIYDIASPFVPVMKEILRMKGIAEDSRCTFPLRGITKEQKERLDKLMGEVGGW